MRDRIDCRTCGGCANGTVSEVGMLGVFYTRQAGLDVKNQSILWMQQQQGDPYTGTTRAVVVPFTLPMLFVDLASTPQFIL